MKLLILIATSWVVNEVTSSGVTIGITPYSHPVQSQYHSQDVYGQYAYGYATPTSTKSEVKTADGVTRGGYSYIDSNGILQTVQYTADPVHGFRVAATNLPQDLPDVAYAKVQHLAQFEATKAEHALLAARVQYANPVAISAAAIQQVPLVSLPTPVQDLPEVIRARAEHLALFEAIKARDLSLQTNYYQAAISPIPAQIQNAVVPVQTISTATAVVPNVNYAQNIHRSYVPAISIPSTSQYQTQDGWGQYSYGYVSPLSSKAETKTADGITRGGYSYIDANGIVQSVNYVADPVNGFRVAATNLPVGPAERAIAAPVQGTVAAAPAIIAPQAKPKIAPAVALVAPEISAPQAQVINAVPEQGWYKQEIHY